MLEGIETGYEEKHDFPDRQGRPERVYMLATVPRTGSTYFSHLLWQSGCLGAPLEYLNFLPGGPYGHASGSVQAQQAQWRRDLQRRTSPNGVFGLKCFPTQMRELSRGNPTLYMEVMSTILPQDRRPYAVRLRRRDRDAHAISYARAALSGIWRKEQEPAEGNRVEFSAQAVKHARNLLDQEEALWDRLFAQARLEPLVLWYEDVVEHPNAAVRQVADVLEVAIDPAAAVMVPQVQKQSEIDPRLWAELYRQSADR